MTYIFLCNVAMKFGQLIITGHWKMPKRRKHQMFDGLLHLIWFIWDFTQSRALDISYPQIYKYFNSVSH